MTGTALFAVVVTFDLVAGAHDAFVELVQHNASVSVECEPGCLRFDVLLGNERGRVLLYEIYADRRAFEMHLETDHFAEFDAASRPLVASKAVTSWSALVNAREPV